MKKRYRKHFLKTINYKLKSRDEGVTLIEFLIYLAVIGLVLASFIFMGLSVTESRIRAHAMREVSQNAHIAMERISRAARRANGIFPGSSFGTNLAAAGGFVAFSHDEAPENPTAFIVRNGALWVLEDWALLLPLTSDDVEVTNLTFENLSSADNRTRNVQVIISVEYQNPNNISSLLASTTLETSFELRDPS